MPKIGTRSRFRFIVRALVNTEGGQLRFATSYPTNCDQCDFTDEGLGPLPKCDICGKSAMQGGNVTSGDGDGIFPILEICDLESDNPLPIAVCVVFDSNYELANRIRGQAEDAVIPTFSFDDFYSYSTLPVITVTNLNPTDLLVFGRGMKNEPAVDCNIQFSDELVARIYAEEPGTYTGNFEAFNSDTQSSVHLPRILAIGSIENLNQVFGTTTSELHVDWESEEAASMLSIVTSHREVVADSVCYANAHISNAYLKDMRRDEHKIRDWDDDYFSWILLGTELQEGWCVEMLATTFGAPDAAKQVVLKSRRVFGEISAIVGEAPQTQPTTMSPKANFCPNCGNKFPSELANFCPNCGKSRGDN